MATLVLTALGSAIGGPIGGSIGAILAQRIDQEIFKPKSRQGPRLADLSLQTSTYGADIPRIYGQMRVAGSVIWSTDLIERKTKTGGKGQPSTIQYSYSASFAVALSCRCILGIKRIWADGTVLRGNDGTFRTATVMRVHNGDTDQPLDTLIASDVGIEHAPAHRGLAYVVFQDFALADYGNRIPSLTFEIEADPVVTPPTVRSMIEDLAPGISSDADFAITGYAASGATAQVAIAPLADAWGLALCSNSLANTGPQRSSMRLAAPFAVAETLRIDRPSRHRQPQSISVRHYDPARDFQVGVQSASLIAKPDVVRTDAAGRTDVIELPLAISADTAAMVVQHRAMRAISSGQKGQIEFGPFGFALRPGDRINLGAEYGMWQIAALECGVRGVAATLLPPMPDRPMLPNADSGQNLPSPAPDMGETRLIIVDLPYVSGIAGFSQANAASGLDPVAQTGATPGLYAAVAGTRAGWRSAAISLRLDSDAPLVPLGQVTGATAIGKTENMLQSASPWFEDRTSRVTITLAGPHMELFDATPAQLYYGTNLALVGAEIIQFAQAEQLVPLSDGNPRYRLSHLLRGRWGSDGATGTHSATEDFLLLDGTGLLCLAGSGAGVGTHIAAISVAESTPQNRIIASQSSAYRPLSPVHPRWKWGANGLEISWIRRSRAGYGWIDGVDSLLGESAERYQITIRSAANSEITLETTVEMLTLSMAQLQAAFPSGSAQYTVHLRQIGDQGLSPPITFTIPQGQDLVWPTT